MVTSAMLAGVSLVYTEKESSHRHPGAMVRVMQSSLYAVAFTVVLAVLTGSNLLDGTFWDGFTRYTWTLAIFLSVPGIIACTIGTDPCNSMSDGLGTALGVPAIIMASIACGDLPSNLLLLGSITTVLSVFLFRGRRPAKGSAGAEIFSSSPLLMEARYCLAGCQQRKIIMLGMAACAIVAIAVIFNHNGTRFTQPILVGLAVISDKNFQIKQIKLIQNQREYAERHGYDFFVLDPEDFILCKFKSPGDFFFQKHCVIRMFLETRVRGYNLFVIDGDCMVTSPEISLDKWVDLDTDVVLHERDWNFEITAGNYMVRNSPLGLHFLERWAHFSHRASLIRGFHSSDNGAIHLVVLELIDSIHASAYSECEELYQKLSSSVLDLDEYYEFIACTRRALGPNRRWTISGYAAGTLIVLHRYHGFAADAHLVGLRGGGNMPFVHGVKDVDRAFRAFRESTPWKSIEEQGARLASMESETACFRNCNGPWSKVPRVGLRSCLVDFSCKVAMGNDDFPLKNAYEDSVPGKKVFFDYNELYENGSHVPT